MTPPPRKYADAPGMASSAAEISPPADDSETAIVCLRSMRSEATDCAAGISSSTLRLQPELLGRVRAFGGVTAADAERVRHFADVHVGLGIHAQSVRSDESAGIGHLRLAPAREQGAIAIEDADAAVRGIFAHAETIRRLIGIPPELGHVRAARAVEHDVRRALDVRPLLQELALGAEDLDPIVLAIAHEHAAVGGDADTVRQHEFPRALARRAPRALELAGRREAMHAAVAIPIGDVQVTVRRDGDVRGPIERSAGPADG